MSGASPVPSGLPGWVTRRRAAIAALAGAALLVLVLVARSFGGSYEITAEFEGVSGLVEGADVRAAGVEVGSVQEISLGDDGMPRVRMKVDDDYPLREGATAEVRALSASGEANRFVSLDAGDGDELPAGATLGLAATDQPVEVDDVLSTMAPRTRADFQAVLHGLATGTGGRGPQIERTLRTSAEALGATADAAAQVNADGEALRTLVSSGRTVVSELAKDPAALASTSDRLAATLRVTAGRQAELARSAQLLPQGLEQPRRALERLDGSIGELRGLVRVGRPAVARLVPFSRELRPTLREAVPTLGQAAGLVEDAPPRLRRISSLLARAEPTINRLEPVLRGLGPVLDEARVRTPDFFSFFSNWADFTGNYDVNGHAARVGLVLTPAPNNLIGPSDSGPGTLEEPFVRTPGALEGDPWDDYEDSFIGGGG